MCLSPQEKTTLLTYNKIAHEWCTDHSSQTFNQKDMLFFKSLLLPAKKIIEIGSGGGRDSLELSGTYDYIGIDISRELIKEAKKTNPSAIFLNQSVYNIEFPENLFDGFWAAASLLHIPKRKIGIALGNIHKIVKNEGIGLISIKQGTGEKMVGKKMKSGYISQRFFSFYKKQEFTDLLQQSGFEVLHINRKKPQLQQHG
ncbi:MAG: class I SAM-dependent methyltransferase [Patescibacteria group bacterium]